MPIFGEPVPSSGNPAGTEVGAPSAPPSTPETPGTPPADTTTAPPAVDANKQYLDTNTLGDHYVKVRVDGADMELPLKDALQGVMMQQAFTRRTQELAEQRKQFGQAQQLVQLLESDPRGTLAQLAKAYEIDMSGITPDAEADPTEQRFAALENQIRQQNQAAARMQIQREIEQLKGQFGEFDEGAVVDYAFQNRLPITTAYRDLNFDRLMQEQQRQGQAANNRANAIAAQIVEGGQATQPGSVGASAPQINSIRDAWNAAKKQHGIN